MFTVKFESETCGRCGGTGRYSFNQIHGDMCYGCSGKGTKLTKDGKAAADAYWAVARPTILAPNVKPGDKLYVESMTKRGTAVVESVQDDDLNPGMIKITFVPDSIIGSHGAWHTTEFNMAKSRETQEAALEAVKGMRGVTITIG